MKDLTLLSVNWNNRPCTELMLKSFIHHHYQGEPLKLMLVDNGSTDDSKEWLHMNGIPFFNFNENIGHENAVNIIYTGINTKYALLVDTDVEFKDDISCYIDCLRGIIGSVGEMIDKNYINAIKIKDRISPWFLMWNVEWVSKCGIEIFRDPNVTDWSYDVASWFTEQLYKAGIENYNLERHPGNQDNDLVSMKYDRFDHIGKLSWDIFNKHQDRIDEVLRRREYVQQRLKEYEHIDLKNKFIYG